MKYDTDKSKEIWMLRYGFGFEEIFWLNEYAEEINQEEIIFKDSVSELSGEKFELINRFVFEELFEVDWLPADIGLQKS